MERIIPARAGFTPRPPDRRPGRGDHPRSRGVYVPSGFFTTHSAGSSPLARGLRRVRGPGDRRPRDHPRSRGVYFRLRHCVAHVTGSSPLARGLQIGWAGRSVVGGIIPARAGFTRRRARRPRRRPDHPRSRGVYLTGWERTRASPGSSPLARGLLRGGVCGDRAQRIIPARAGVTGAWPRGPSAFRDHPRSRGVYATTSPPASARTGSSPLARGLPSTQKVSLWARLDHPRSRGVYSSRGSSLRRWTWIIPARAGFTDLAPCPTRGRGDHPRSRGVYVRTPPSPSSRAGSSPLARGLPPGRFRAVSVARIIPARAGFTCVRSQPSASDRGSSPLVRGLRVGGSAQGVGLGIIPARAGFTDELTPPDPAGKDHPRSRGVYSASTSTSTPMIGSSPLARGLRGRLRPAGRVRRIIPARAGFTSVGAPTMTRWTDHPRSRGVYARIAMGFMVVSGSSPLARGLLADDGTTVLASGIIPARAGFTGSSHLRVW